MSTDNSFTELKIITSDDLTKRSYITFYFKGQRIREYNGNNLSQRIFPNRAVTQKDRLRLLHKLQYELNKALETGLYPVTEHTAQEKLGLIKKNREQAKPMSAIRTLFEAIRAKLQSNLEIPLKLTT